MVFSGTQASGQPICCLVGRSSVGTLGDQEGGIKVLMNFKCVSERAYKRPSNVEYYELWCDQQMAPNFGIAPMT